MSRAAFASSYAALKRSTIWQRWASTHRADAQRLDGYVASVAASGPAGAPAVGAGFGRQLLAGWAALLAGDVAGFRASYAALKRTTEWSTYARANPREARLVDTWVSNVSPYSQPAAPAIGTLFGRYIVAGWAALSGGASPPGHFGPSGAWRPTGGGGSSTDTGVQSLQAIHQGAGDFTSAGYSFSAFPHATKVVSVYRIATEASFLGVAYSDPQSNYDSQSVVCGEQMNLNPSWKAVSPTTGLPLHSFFGDHSGLIPDLGNTNFQKAAADNVIELCTAKGVTALYIDNMHGYIRDLTFEVEVPSGYSSDADWRARAAIPFIVYFVGRLHAAGVYVYMNAFDVADAALGETGIDQDSGVTQKRFWRELVVAGMATVGVGVFREYFEQEPDGSPHVSEAPFLTGDDAWYHHWTGWQSLVAAAQTLGLDFHGLVYNNGSGTPKYGLVSALLDLDLTRRGTVWAWGPGTGSANPFTDADLTLELGWPALTGHMVTGSLHWRQFPGGVAVVNPSGSSDTQTILGVSRSLASGTADIF